MIGSNIIPDTISLFIFKAKEIAKWGIPCKKFVVPSIGSIIQTLSTSAFFKIPDSSVIKENFFFDLESSSISISSALLSVLVTKSLGPLSHLI